MDTGRETPNFCVGCDIGYGNGKFVGGPVTSTEPVNVVLPVGAAPIAQIAKGFNNRIDVGDGAVVLIAGEEWVAGVSPLDLQSFARPTHKDYPKTPEYLALFYAGLAKLGKRHICTLVTGLPVSQYYQDGSPKMSDFLVQRLQGEHHIQAGMTVTVDKVVVVPQPAGAFRDQLTVDKSFAADSAGLSLVIDVGYFSVDWVLMRGSKVMDTNSGSSVKATSKILEQAASQISKANGGVQLSMARLEAAYRTGRETMSLGGNEVDYQTFLDAAARDLSGGVMNEIATSLREVTDGIDRILVTGGGAPLFERGVRKAFGGSKVSIGENAVLANASGFWQVAKQVARHDRK